MSYLKTFAAMEFLIGILCCLGVRAAMAASAANTLVTVSCNAPRAQVVVNGNDFDVFAPGYIDSFVTNVMVTANGGWEIVEPTALPLRMKGGDTATDKVICPPECKDGGTIAFHNYYISSDRDGGLKDIVVEAGASVTYTAHKNGSLCDSDWTVNGETETDTSSIVFNRNWWDVPSWFIPSMDTPKPGVYNINAHDVQHTVLNDSGSMTVVGVKRISGPNGKYSEKDSSANLTVQETIIVKKGGTVALTATPEPNVAWPSGWPTWDASCGFWCLGNHFTGETTGQSTVDLDTSSPDSIVVTASCGESEKCIKVVAYELGLSLSKSNLTLKHDCDTEFTVVANPSSELSTPMIQVRRNDIGASNWPNWMDLVSGSGSIDWKARVAGIFKLRIKALVAGTEYFSNENDLTVEFPTYDQITADATVRTAMNNEWQATLDDCTQNPNRSRERGFWVSLDTSGDEAYSCGASVFGGWVTGPSPTSANWPTVDLGERPGSNLSDVSPISKGTVYAVSSFHTHNPPTYLTIGYDAGPSDSDSNCDTRDNVAGIVYDYSIQFIPAGYPKDSPAQLYQSRNRRLLSAE